MEILEFGGIRQAQGREGEGGGVISDVKVSIPNTARLCSFPMLNIDHPVKHEQDGDTIKFTLNDYQSALASAFGIKIIYTTEEGNPR